MEPTLADVVRPIQDLTIHVNTRLVALSTCIDTLETTVQRIREGDELYGRGHNHGRDHNFRGNGLRLGHHNLDDRDIPDHDEKLMGRVKIEAPTFDGRLNPKVFSDWMREMDHFFEWYDFSEEKRARFAKMKLIARAKLHWESVENHLRKTHQLPITGWQEMKAKLSEKYLHVSYLGNLLDQWHNLRQGTRSITDYIELFEEHRIRCDVVEDESVTLSKFRRGLNEDLRRELIVRDITALDQAYNFVQNYELVIKPQIWRRIDTRPMSTPSHASKPLGDTPGRFPVSP
jgi:hypothetical protein